MFGLKYGKKVDYNTTLRGRVFVASLLLSFLITIFSASYALAMSADMSKTYMSTGELIPGQIVALSGRDANNVVIAKQDDTQRVLGVVVATSDSTLEFNSGNSTGQEVNVALAGRATVLIGADVNDIGRGDLIGIGSQDGIGEKAKPGYQTVGVAEVASSQLETESGYKRMPIIVTPGVAEAAITQDNVFARVVGKDVSVMQMVFATLIAFFGLVAIGFLSYSSVRHSMVAVGRNPLAKPAILGAMVQVMVMVSLIAIVSVGLMYITLRA